VKESMALMYQMLQLPGEALVQYEEMEALLAFAPKSMQKVFALCILKEELISFIFIFSLRYLIGRS